MSKRSPVFFFRQLRQLLDDIACLLCRIFVIVKVLQQFNWERTFWIVESVYLVLADSVDILSSQESSSKRAPTNKAVVVILIEVQIFHFVLSPCQHAVLRLRANWLVQVESLTDSQCIEDAFSIPVGSCPVKGFSILDDLMETSANFFKWCLVIIEVGINDIHVIQLQSLQRSVEAFLDMLPADKMIRVDVRLWCPSDLGCNDDVFSIHFQALNDLSKLNLSFSSIIHLSCIKVIDSVSQGNLYDLFIDCVVLLLGVDHVSEGND